MITRTAPLALSLLGPPLSLSQLEAPGDVAGAPMVNVRGPRGRARAAAPSSSGPSTARASQAALERPDDEGNT